MSLSGWQTRRMAALAAVLLATAETMAQDPMEGRRRPVRRVVVSIPDRKAALLEDGRISRIYAVAVGAPVSPSPIGVYQIVQRVPNPAWYRPGKVVPPGGNNPLGTRWLGLNLKGYGIHGTNNPGSIGRRASHGCIRMRNRDVEELFEKLQAGDVVELRGERDPEINQIFSAVAVVE